MVHRTISGTPFTPIERLWAVMDQHVPHDTDYPARKQFAGAILAFFRENLPREWKRFCEQAPDNFRITTHQNFPFLEG